MNEIEVFTARRGLPGPDSTVPGPAPTVSWEGYQLRVGGVLGPSLRAPANIITFDGTVIEVDGVPGPDLKGDQGDPGLTVRYPFLDVSSPLVITAGRKPGKVVLPFGITTTRWRLFSDVPTNATVRIWNGNTQITGSVLPTLANQDSATGTVLTGWITDLAIGNALTLEVVTNSAAKYLGLILEGV